MNGTSSPTSSQSGMSNSSGLEGHFLCFSGAHRLQVGAPALQPEPGQKSIGQVAHLHEQDPAHKLDVGHPCFKLCPMPVPMQRWLLSYLTEMSFSAQI